MHGTFQCTIVTPEAQILDEQVSYASIPAHDGQIGLASLRAPLLVKLGEGSLRLEQPGGEPRWFFIAGGFAQMKDDRLAILTPKAVPATQIDAAEAKAALSEALAFKAQSDEQIERRDRDTRQARAMLDLATKHGK